MHDVLRYSALVPRLARKPGVRQTADTHTKPFRRSFVDAVHAAREHVHSSMRSREELITALSHAGSTLRTILHSHFSRLILETMAAGGRETATRARKRGSFRAAKKGPLGDLSFDMTNPRAVAWARNHSSQLITGIDEQTRKAIQRIIGESFEQGIPIDKAARRIRPLIGLREDQIDAVNSLRDALIDADGGDKIWAGSRAIRVPDDFDDDWLEGKLTDYADRLIASRADLIARTEAIASANYGQQELWLQATDDGLLRGDEQREWIVTPDDRLCPYCEALEGSLAPVDGTFEGPDGEKLDGPPAHPNCRCAQGLALPEEEERIAGGPGSGNFGHAGRPGAVGGSGEGGGKLGNGGAPSPRLVGSGGTSQRLTAQRITSTLRSTELPKGAATGMKKIEIHDNLDTPKDVAAGLSTAGWYDAWGKNAGVLKINGADPDNATEVLHEIGHHVHLAKLDSASSDEWASISRKGKAARISAYARTNTGEHFSEAFQAYARGGAHREKLRKLEPKTHNFMSRLWKTPRYSRTKISQGEARRRYKQ